jgi:hypothetical protein
MRHAVERVYFLTVAAMFAGGCGQGGTSESPDQAEPAAPSQAAAPSQGAGIKGYDCDVLLTTDELHEIAGPAARRVSGLRGDQNTEVPGITDCGYQVDGSVGMSFYVYTGGGSGEGLEAFTFLWDRNTREGAQAVTGIGDAALLRSALGGRELVVRAQGAGIRVGAASMEGRSSVDLDALLRRVATNIVPRL